MLRVAVVGVGYLGRYHVEKYRAIEGVSLVGVADIDPAAARRAAADFGVPCFTDHRELAGRVDAVTIAASTAAHFELARFFLERDVHVLVEKPMTRTSAEGRELTELAERRGLKLQVGHVERFNPALVAARERLGDVRFIESHRLAPFKARGADVNVVLDLMIHDLDVVLALTGSTPVEVSAVGVAVLTEHVDIASARIGLANGAVANLTASRASTAAQRKFRVFQRNQYLALDLGEGTLRRVENEGGKLEEETFRPEKRDALLDEVRAFVTAVRDDQPCPVTGRDGVAALELAEAVIADIDRRSGGRLTWG
ncbi:MAG TPA: Gfo/Idh/MocA family oxidoreductase [Gammaproteobacteria bacterium]